jgi:hypothetical protein
MSGQGTEIYANDHYMRINSKVRKNELAMIYTEGTGSRMFHADLQKRGIGMFSKIL